MLMGFDPLAWDCPFGSCFGVILKSPSADAGGASRRIGDAMHQAGRRQPIPSHETQAACAARPRGPRGGGLPGGLVAQLVRAHA